ncbi:MAG: UbiA family prenyltransferase [Gemmatimonadota bacterium]|nr:MAG: UbiA family prenyltransferase [Gemmatimonadota bacterium]
MASRAAAESSARAQPARVLSGAFLRGYATTMRPYLLFVSGITGLAGMALAAELPIGSTLLLALAFFLSYGFGQALTDCFQLDTDALSAPYRPLVQGAIERRDVLAVSIGGLIGVGAVLAVYNPWNIPLAALAVAGLASYTPFKRRWWAGPFYNAWIVVVLAMIGHLCGVGRFAESQFAGAVAQTPALPAMLAGVFFGYANFVLAGYYKDISADRATGYRTLPVVFGLRPAAFVSDAFALLALAACGVAVWAALADGLVIPGHDVALLFLAAGTGATVIAQLRLHRVRHEGEAHRAIAPVVHAYILLLSAVAVAFKPAWSSALAIFYIAFLAAMKGRPMRRQI